MDKIEKEERPCCRDGCNDSCCSETVAKQTCLALRNTMEIAEECDSESREPTILDILNKDCWYELFRYLSVNDLVLSERVSQGWRRLVRQYLEGIRIRLSVGSSESHFLSYYECPTKVKCRGLRVHPYYFMDVIDRFNRAIVTADCFDAATLRYLEENCPDLEDLRIQTPDFRPHCEIFVVRFEKLKQLTFNNVGCRSDDFVAKFLSVNTPEELVIVNTDSEYSTTLAMLPAVFQGLVDAICGLSQLRQLGLHNIKNVQDDCLEAFGRSLRELQAVRVGGCTSVTAAGVTALCRVLGNNLIELDVSKMDHVTDDVVVHWINLCPKLEILDLTDCRRLTRALPAARGVLPRERRLRMRLAGTDVERAQLPPENFEVFTLDYSWPHFILDFTWPQYYDKCTHCKIVSRLMDFNKWTVATSTYFAYNKVCRFTRGGYAHYM